MIKKHLNSYHFLYQNHTECTSVVSKRDFNPNQRFFMNWHNLKTQMFKKSQIAESGKISMSYAISFAYGSLENRLITGSPHVQPTVFCG